MQNILCLNSLQFNSKTVLIDISIMLTVSLYYDRQRSICSSPSVIQLHTAQAKRYQAKQFLSMQVLRSTSDKMYLHLLIGV